MLIGLAVLLLGTLVYLVDRVPEETLVPDSIGLFSPVPSLFGVVGHNLPTFTHVFAFILLTVALLNRSKRISITVCVGWLLVDSAFEVGQHAYLLSGFRHSYRRGSSTYRFWQRPKVILFMELSIP